MSAMSTVVADTWRVFGQWENQESVDRQQILCDGDIRAFRDDLADG